MGTGELKPCSACGGTVLVYPENVTSPLDRIDWLLTEIIPPLIAEAQRDPE